MNFIKNDSKNKGLIKALIGLCENEGVLAERNPYNGARNMRRSGLHLSN